MTARVFNRFVVLLLVPTLLVDSSWANAVQKNEDIPAPPSSFAIQAIPPERGNYTQPDFDRALSSRLMRAAEDARYPAPVLKRRTFSLAALGAAFSLAAFGQALPIPAGQIAELQAAARDLFTEGAREAAMKLLLGAAARIPRLHAQIIR